jgi:catechol 2,3-dioxygenase-like lactoylglutathione lyase family enzyme
MRITSVEFETTDLLRAESFYGSLLGLPTTRENGTLTIRAGASTLALRQGPASPGKQHLAFTIPRLMFNSARKWAAERVSLLRDSDGRDEFEMAPYWNARSLYFADPDGNILEFIIRRDISDHRAGPFRAEHIQCISEVGIPARSVPDVAAQAQSAFGIDAYGAGAPAFQPVGNIDGLLILVTPGRHWFPTAAPGGARRLLVNIESQTRGTLEPQRGITIHSNAAAR